MTVGSFVGVDVAGERVSVGSIVGVDVAPSLAGEEVSNRPYTPRKRRNSPMTTTLIMTILAFTTIIITISRKDTRYKRSFS